MKLLLDVNLSPAWTTYLAEHGIASTHWSLVAATNAPDEALYAHAVAEGFILLTQDLDFSTRLAMRRDALPSVIVIRAGRVNPLLLGPRVLLALQTHAEALLRGALIMVEVRRIRVKRLPLH